MDPPYRRLLPAVVLICGVHGVDDTTRCLTLDRDTKGGDCRLSRRPGAGHGRPVRRVHRRHAEPGRAERGRRGYEVTIASVDGDRSPPAPAWYSSLNRCPTRRARGHRLLPGGMGLDDAREEPRVDRLGQAASPNARRIVSVCTGAFLAAQAGLLDGCRATTHWAFADRCQRIPRRRRGSRTDLRAELREGVDRGGGTAGIDLALSLVEEDHGTEVAQTVARWMVHVPATARRPDPIRRAGVDAARQAGPHPRGAGGHRGRTRCCAQHHRTRPPRRDEPSPFHPGVHRRGRRGAGRLRRPHPHRGRASAAGGDR